jgi:hypothetical protein
MWYLYTIEFYSATQKNEILSFASECMELENIILSEVSQAQKDKNCMFSLRPKTNAVNIIGHGSHIKGRTHIGGIEKGRKPKT